MYFSIAKKKKILLRSESNVNCYPMETGSVYVCAIFNSFAKSITYFLKQLKKSRNI